MNPFYELFEKKYIGIDIKKIGLFLVALSFLWGSSATVRILFHMQLILFPIYALVFLIYTIKMINEKKCNWYIYILGVFYIVYFVSTWFGNKSNIVFFYMFESLGVTVFLNYELEKDVYKITNTFQDAAVFSIFLNLILLIVQPGGMAGADRTAYYFLGYRIAFTPYVFLAIFLGILVDNFEGRKFISKKTIFTITISIITLFMKDVGTGLVSVGFFICYAMYSMVQNKSVINIWVAYIVYLVGVVAIIVFGVQHNIRFIAYVLEDLLGRDTTFDNRTYIWDATIHDIILKPWLGYGVDHAAIVTFPYSVKSLPAHNQLLCVLADVGIIGFIVFLLLFIIIGVSIGKIGNDRIKGIMVAAIIGELIIFFTEIQTTKCLVFIVLIYVYKCKDILPNTLINERNKI